MKLTCGGNSKAAAEAKAAAEKAAAEKAAAEKAVILANEKAAAEAKKVVLRASIRENVPTLYTDSWGNFEDG